MLSTTTNPSSTNGARPGTGTNNSGTGYSLQKDTTLTKIFVGGLPYHTTDESLRCFFEQFGPIEEAVVITDRQTGKSRGYGFVTMERKEDALIAIRDPNPCIDGRKANVNLAVLGAKPRLMPGTTQMLPFFPLQAGLNPGEAVSTGSPTGLFSPANNAFVNPMLTTGGLFSSNFGIPAMGTTPGVGQAGTPLSGLYPAPTATTLNVNSADTARLSAAQLAAQMNHPLNNPNMLLNYQASAALPNNNPAALAMAMAMASANPAQLSPTALALLMSANAYGTQGNGVTLATATGMNGNPYLTATSHGAAGTAGFLGMNLNSPNGTNLSSVQTSTYGAANSGVGGAAPIGTGPNSAGGRPICSLDTSVTGDFNAAAAAAAAYPNAAINYQRFLNATTGPAVQIPSPLLSNGTNGTPGAQTAAVQHSPGAISGACLTPVPFAFSSNGSEFLGVPGLNGMATYNGCGGQNIAFMHPGTFGTEAINGTGMSNGSVGTGASSDGEACAATAGSVTTAAVSREPNGAECISGSVSF